MKATTRQRVVIVGGGIVGAAVAYACSRYTFDTVLLERENDVATGATRANSGIVHAGYDPPPNSAMARHNVRGAALYPALCQALDVPYQACGSLVVARSERERMTLFALCEQGRRNGVTDLSVLPAEAVRAREPHVAADVMAALWAPTAGIVNPWALALALIETAMGEGVKVLVNAPVEAVHIKDGRYVVTAGCHKVEADVVINAAGLSADRVSQCINPPYFHLTAVKGEYFLFDKPRVPCVRHVLFRLPSASGKGVLVAPTVHGNVIVGPDAMPTADRDDTATDADRLAFVAEEARALIPTLPFDDTIRTFSGLRATSDDDFIIRAPRSGWIDVAGIKSPGLTAAPALAETVVAMVEDVLGPLTMRSSWCGERRVVRVADLSPEVLSDVIAANRAYGVIVCRCETVSEGEVRAACHRGVTPCSLDAIKRRTGAGMGRCQGAFCGGRVLRIVAEETGVDPTHVLKDREGSVILVGRTKGGGR